MRPLMSTRSTSVCGTPRASIRCLTDCLPDKPTLNSAARRSGGRKVVQLGIETEVRLLHITPKH